ncbi:lantibiotic dehydratase [Kitasatospora sp. NPDC059577]|uniref:lantibiotic dehydratase n=1 Tax=Kitasatospora sp. NPDC059577 TaxID=3346873 RepID=UPI00369D7D75
MRRLVVRRAGVSVGRFLHLLEPERQAAFTALLTGLPTMDEHAVTAQLSFPPLDPASGHVARSLATGQLVISLAEHRPTTDGVLGPQYLAVGCDGRRMYLAAPTLGVRIEAAATHALNLRTHTPSLARLITELSRAQAAQVTRFDWGSLHALPFRPRLRHGRVILSPAIWRLIAADLPSGSTSQQRWDEALMAWMARLRAPRHVLLTASSQGLPLDLDNPGHRALLRDHLCFASHAVLVEEPDPADLGWADGRAHEIVVPVTAARTPTGRACPSPPRPASCGVATVTPPAPPACSSPLSTATRNVRTPSSTEATLDSITVPARLTETTEQRAEVVAWLWRVVIADGTRALTSAGRWTDAVRHIEAHRGFGRRILDGRQTAILAAATTGDLPGALALLAATEPGEAWENAVTAVLTALCRPGDRHAAETAIGHCLAFEPDDGLAVFSTHLALTAINAAGTDTPSARNLIEQTASRTTEGGDGYALRDLLAHPGVLDHLPPGRTAELEQALVACALGSATLPEPVRRRLETSLAAARAVLQTSSSDPGLSGDDPVGATLPDRHTPTGVFVRLSGGDKLCFHPAERDPVRHNGRSEPGRVAHAERQVRRGDTALRERSVDDL